MSRRKILVISITILMLLLVSTIFGFVDNSYKPKYAVTTQNVNFRKQANLNYSSVVRTIPAGTPFKIVGEVSDFYIVQLTSNEVGLITKSFSKIQGDSLPGALVYESVSKYYATINGDSTNVRSGPGTNFSSYGKLNAGTKVQVIGRINNFDLIVTENNLVGMVRTDLMTKSTGEVTTPPSNGNNNNNSNQGNISISDLQKLVLELINKSRIENGLAPLSVDSLLQATAQNKAIDMVKNNYFSHQSPTYGSPFNMMKNAGITFKTAGENIAGNPSVENAVKAWLASDTHRQNILSNAYNYVGIGIQKSDKYGYVIVAMFIGK